MAPARWELEVGFYAIILFQFHLINSMSCWQGGNWNWVKKNCTTFSHELIKIPLILLVFIRFPAQRARLLKKKVVAPGAKTISRGWGIRKLMPPPYYLLPPPSTTYKSLGGA